MPPFADVSRPPLALDLCLVAHYAYGALTGGREGHVGGVERQTSLMARWLSARGHKVGIVTWQEGPPHDEVIDGVHVIKTCRIDRGWPLIRFVYPRWTALNSALNRANAKTYYQNCAEYVTGQVALWTRFRSRRFVYSVANDTDCDPHLPDLRTPRERWLYRYGIRNADTVIAQTNTQAQMLKRAFGVESARVIPMPCPGPSETDFVTPEWKVGGRVLWVGRLCRFKRPDRLLSVAAACPEVSFDVVGPITHDPYVASVVARARELHNVTLHGRAPRTQMDAFYRQAAVLLCTSDWEGFPNTFLEAWSHGVPVVSTHDPDGIIAQLRLGAAAPRDPLAVAGALRSLLRARDTWTVASVNARRHYVANHTVDHVMKRFEAELLGGPA